MDTNFTAFSSVFKQKPLAKALRLAAWKFTRKRFNRFLSHGIAVIVVLTVSAVVAVGTVSAQEDYSP